MSVWEDVVGQESAVAAFTAAAQAAREAAEQREAQAAAGVAPEAARGVDGARGGGAGSGATSPAGLAMTHRPARIGPLECRPRLRRRPAVHRPRTRLWAVQALP